MDKDRKALAAADIAVGIENFTTAWKEDWGLLVDGIAAGCNITRTEAMAYYAMVQVEKFTRGALQAYAHTEALNNKAAETLAVQQRVLEHAAKEIDSEQDILGD